MVPPPRNDARVNNTRLNDARLIVSAARRFLGYVRKESSGISPASWRLLYLRHEIVCGPVDCPPSFGAKLWYCQEYGLWVVGYNWRARGAGLSRMLAHEFFEWLAVTDHIGLFDELPGVYAVPGASESVYCYDGGADPDAIHHRIARRGERLCFRGL